MARPKSDDPAINAGICLRSADLDYLRTFHPSSMSQACSDLIAEHRKFSPGGAGKTPRPDPACRNAPGTRNDLKRTIKMYRAALVAAGIDPDKIS